MRSATSWPTPPSPADKQLISPPVPTGTPGNPGETHPSLPWTNPLQPPHHDPFSRGRSDKTCTPADLQTQCRTQTLHRPRITQQPAPLRTERAVEHYPSPYAMSYQTAPRPPTRKWLNTSIDIPKPHPSFQPTSVPNKPYIPTHPTCLRPAALALALPPTRQPPLPLPLLCPPSRVRTPR